MRVAHIKMSEEVMSYDCPKCGSGGATVVGGYHNGWLPMSRREQRRARKAAKNRAMVKLVGWRPWSPGSYGHTKLADRTVYGTKKIPGDAMDQVSWWWMQEWDNEERDFHGKRFAARLPDFMNDKLIHLREPSGFKAMSRVADLVALDAKLAALNVKHQASMAKLEADGISIYAGEEEAHHDQA